jgi:hypothetical protein
MSPERGQADRLAIPPDVNGFKTPEEAVRAGLPGVDVRVVGVVVRGDEAVVAQIVNADGYPHAYETETATCYRGPNGWEEASSGNGNGAQINTSGDRMTYIWWDQAAPGATAARVGLGDQEQTVPVKDGFFFAVFDEVPYQQPQRPAFLDGPTWTVERGPMTPEESREELRAFLGHDPPELREWLYGGDVPA